MSTDIYSLLIAPALGCFTVISLIVVTYLLRLEIMDRRRKRRMEQQLEQLFLNRRYKRSSRFLSQKPVLILPPASTNRMGAGHGLQKFDRWNSATNNLN